MAIHRDREQLTISSRILLYALAAGSIVGQFKMFGDLRSALYPDYAMYRANRRMESTIYRLRKQGWIKTQYVESKRIISLTRKGELEALLQKSRLRTAQTVWDGKWRMVVFDIPERAHAVRDRLRELLKEHGFRALQASVYVYPYALNMDAINYLKYAGLDRYIRFALVEAMDDDSDLRREFRHVISKTSGRGKTR